MFKIYIGKLKSIKIIAPIVAIIFSIVLGIYIVKKEKNNSVNCNTSVDEYVLGGQAVGIKLLASGVLVMGIEDKSLNLQVGDIILKVNGNEINTNVELEEYIQQGNKMVLTIQRNCVCQEVEIIPKFNGNTGKYYLGVWVKDSSAGVGTITVYNKSRGTFAALGHGITETYNEEIVPILSGGITQTEILSVKKGEESKPGELKGTISNEIIGQIYLNTINGIYGKMEQSQYYMQKETIEIGTKDEVEEGAAKIYVTLDDNITHEYNIEIEKILSKGENKNMCIRVTDEELFNRTGGIVQGMSGAPIVQNNKLIGAVTHVFLDDPKRGYGIFIENMINEMNAMI